MSRFRIKMKGSPPVILDLESRTPLRFDLGDVRSPRLRTM